MTNEKKAKRNSLIELYRFLFAMWVVWYHDYFFLPKSSYFADGYLAVDFFFMLTGFFIMGLIKKQSEKSFFKGACGLVWKKLKPLIITLAIAIVFAQIYFWSNLDDLGDPIGYMWYFEWFLVVPLLYYVIYRLVRNEKIFYSIIGAIVVLSYILLNTVCIQWGFFRGTVGIGIGILISIIPKPKLKYKGFNFSILIALAFLAGTIVSACFKTYIPNSNPLFILFLFPGLLYFTTCFKTDIKVLNYLGGLSFGIYAYQTVCRVLELYGVYNKQDNFVEMFLILMSLAIADDLIKRLVRFIIKKKKEKKELINEKTSQDL